MNQNGLDVPCAPNASWDIMERYAAFAEDILSLRPDADIQTTKKAIFKAIQEKNYYDPFYAYFAKWVPQQVAKIRRCVSDEKSL